MNFEVGNIVHALHKHGFVKSILTNQDGTVEFVLLESPDLVARGAYKPSEVVPIELVKLSSEGELIKEIDLLIGLMNERIDQLKEYKLKAITKGDKNEI